MDKNKLGAIVLAAGKGKRMNSRGINKVVLPLANKPMIVHSISFLENVGISQIVVVVGFAKKSVMEVLGTKVMFAEQHKRLGTGHAVVQGLKKMPREVENILVINGDDSAFYTEEVIKNLAEKHLISNASLTFLTIDKQNPFGLGRVIRDEKENVKAIVEEKDATDVQRKVTEVNPGCYIFKSSFLRKYLPLVKKSPITGEYYLTSLIDVGIKNNEKIETLKAGSLPWRGVNTKDELLEAERLFISTK